MPYQGKSKSRLTRRRHACVTHALWRHTKENAEIVLNDADTRLERIHCDPIPRKTPKSLTDKEKRVKHMYFDTVPRKTQKRS